MAHHVLKTHPEYFQKTWENKKLFEIRKNDRDFEVGDFVTLREFCPPAKILNCDSGSYTGRNVRGIITYVTDFEQRPGYVVFGIEVIGTISFIGANSTDIRL